MYKIFGGHEISADFHKKVQFLKKIALLYIYAKITSRTISLKIYMETKNILMLFTTMLMPVGFFALTKFLDEFCNFF